MQRGGQFIMKEWMVMSLFWAFYFFMAVFGRGTYWTEMGTINLIMIVVSFPATFYVNAYGLMPALLKKKRWIVYVLTLILFLIFLESVRVLMYGFDAQSLNADGTQQAAASFFGRQNIFPSFFLGFICSMGYVTMRDWLLNIGIIERLKSEKMTAELAFLKSQVDPHFLFNTLNNLYAMALEEKGFKTADGIAQLGGLMRYNLHDAQEEFISIGKEIEYIEKYIALQQLRTNSNNVIKVTIQKNDPSGYACKIAPMLLIPFIENACKYGISPSEETLVIIQLRVEIKRLLLTTENTIVAGMKIMKGKGIGLQNVKSRLERLYPGKHSLEIAERKGVFIAKLEINLAS
ncbi:MAG: sensor histidine kinase [Chitinophagaceae bacterium]|nr:sensor histidine kinase [Chitinophagaceae bacterium]